LTTRWAGELLLVRLEHRAGEGVSTLPDVYEFDDFLLHGRKHVSIRLYRMAWAVADNGSTGIRRSGKGVLVDSYLLIVRGYLHELIHQYRQQLSQLMDAGGVGPVRGGGADNLSHRRGFVG